MLGKLMFHNKNRMVPGNFSMKTVALENIDAGDMFELCVDFLDQIENTILLMKTIFNSFEKGNKSISLTKEGQCRLAALVILAYITNHVLYLRYITYKLRGPGRRELLRNLAARLTLFKPGGGKSSHYNIAITTNPWVIATALIVRITLI